MHSSKKDSEIATYFPSKEFLKFLLTSVVLSWKLQRRESRIPGMSGDIFREYTLDITTRLLLDTMPNCATKHTVTISTNRLLLPSVLWKQN